MSEIKERIDQGPGLIEPFGERLIDLVVKQGEQEQLREYGNSLQSLRLSRRTFCDLELMAIGGFSPLDRFMGAEDYRRVLEEMRLGDGTLFPIPVPLPVTDGENIKLDQDIALRDSRNELLGVMRVEEIYEWDLRELATKVLGKYDLRHPLVTEMERWGNLNISGPLQVLQIPTHHDFQDLRLTPKATRDRLAAMRAENVVAFQTRNPLHRVHEEMARRAMDQTNGALLLHPAVGMTKPGDVDHYTRVRTYKTLVSKYFANKRVVLALLPLAMRLAGPREAVLHALIRRNYGANYLIVGRDHASPGRDSNDGPFYPPYAAQALVEEYSEELGVKPIAFRELVYLPDEDRYEDSETIPEDTKTQTISGSELREEYLDGGRQLPSWYTREEVAEILTDAHPPKYRQGVCVWFTGLSGAGKSTTADVLTSLLLENGRRVTLLDGDVVRTHLSKGLGFSREDRDTNVRRIGFVAAEVVRHGGVAVCAAVSPYRTARNDVRRMIGSDRFIEIFVDTPLEVCEDRDTKGMYARARRGEIKGFTGIDDPYESPEKPEIVLDTIDHSPTENSEKIIDSLRRKGFLR